MGLNLNEKLPSEIVCEGFLQNREQGAGNRQYYRYQEF